MLLFMCTELPPPWLNNIAPIIFCRRFFKIDDYFKIISRKQLFVLKISFKLEIFSVIKYERLKLFSGFFLISVSMPDIVFL